MELDAWNRILNQRSSLRNQATDVNIGQNDIFVIQLQKGVVSRVTRTCASMHRSAESRMALCPRSASSNFDWVIRRERLEHSNHSISCGYVIDLDILICSLGLSHCFRSHLRWYSSNNIALWLPQHRTQLLPMRLSMTSCQIQSFSIESRGGS